MLDKFFEGKPDQRTREEGDVLMNTFICYERCTTCKKAQKWLYTKGGEYKVRPIREKNPTAA